MRCRSLVKCWLHRYLFWLYLITLDITRTIHVCVYVCVLQVGYVMQITGRPLSGTCLGLSDTFYLPRFCFSCVCVCVCVCVAGWLCDADHWQATVWYMCEYKYECLFVWVCSCGYTDMQVICSLCVNMHVLANLYMRGKYVEASVLPKTRNSCIMPKSAFILFHVHCSVRKRYVCWYMRDYVCWYMRDYVCWYMRDYVCWYMRDFLWGFGECEHQVIFFP